MGYFLSMKKLFKYLDKKLKPAKVWAAGIALFLVAVVFVAINHGLPFQK